MVKLIILATVFSSVATAAGAPGQVPGWFRTVPGIYRIRGGTTYVHHLYPDALSNVVHEYAEIDKHTDEEIEAIHEVKATPTKKGILSDEDYDEDPFFHALLHNDDDDSSVVNVSTEPTTARVDEALFQRLHEKLFHHHDETEHEPVEKVDVHEILDDMFE